MNTIVRPEANGDVTEALVWLIQKRRHRVAAQLWQFWNDGLDAIENRPLMYPLAEDRPRGRDVRNYWLPRYGYRIVYVVNSTEIVVLAFARGQRRAGHWSNRF